MIKFKAKYLKALSPFRATNDPRYYLSGIRVEPHPHGGALLVATNGHMMMCVYDPSAICSEPLLFSVAPDAARFCGSAKRSTPEASVHINPITERLIITGGCDVRELFVQPGKCTLQTGAHTYPDWRRVVPALSDLTPGFADCVQAAYLEQAGKAHPLRKAGQANASIRTWQAKETDIIAIEFNGAPEYMLLIMPIRDSHPADQMRDLWADAFRAQAATPDTAPGSDRRAA